MSTVGQVRGDGAGFSADLAAQGVGAYVTPQV
jgi:hypothetical protein